jgi:alkylhydroperoxidase family enzyme
VARVPYIPPEGVSPEFRHILTPPTNLKMAVANNPIALDVFFSRIGKWLGTEAPLDARLRELAIVQVAYVTANAYEFSWHLRGALRAGATDQDIDALMAETNGETTSLPALDRAALKAARDITLELSLSDETWTLLEQHLGRERLIELVLAITYYNHVVRVAAVLKLEIDEHVKLPMDKYPPPARIGVWR